MRVRAMGSPSNATEASILRATGELLEEHALDDLSVARILARAGVSRATFYFYFSSRDDAFVAVLSRIAEDLILRFEELLAGTDVPADPAAAAAIVAAWLRLDTGAHAVIRSAVHEWPRRPEIRRVYLDGVGRLADALAAKIDVDRASGAAPEGVESGQLAATLLWTMERTLAGALAGESGLEDTTQVTELLGRLFVATVYGR